MVLLTEPPPRPEGHLSSARAAPATARPAVEPLFSGYLYS